jgi:hypothetical protein
VFEEKINISGVNSEKKEGIIEQKNKISLEVILNNIALYL